ncbi:Membrane protein OS=Rhodopirellula maiorica SM1 GN=RMSM_00424 PE=4 SV=1 [Gemmata massiliana]|uniref:Membrane protein n=1 Tax=Gemmata massiliana TaxID=1210884 RepID=A0A6P2CQB2_9BACT|nr:hypothetical protein [Gemmata massiliana]VTR90757.1 Membrane protein OS=Rhodopirellula maiorica SM1 GN=RMSM_00424 PE=4 SV=1 [Gemmata massiliana]
MNYGADRANEGRRGHAVVSGGEPQLAEEELETGEPISGELEPKAPKKIPALKGRFDAKPSVEVEASEPSSGGQMVLATAKYLKPDEYNTDSVAKKKKKSAPQPGNTGNSEQSLEGRVFHSGFWGGLLAMVVAVIWFFAGLANDTLYFYPPILFVIGLGAIFKGTTSGE